MSIHQQRQLLMTFRQKVSYLDAELKEHVATKTIRYFLGKEENAERVITRPDIYKVLNPIDFYESCYDGTMITYKTPSGKVYTEPKGNDSISRKQDIKDLPKVYTK